MKFEESREKLKGLSILEIQAYLEICLEQTEFWESPSEPETETEILEYYSNMRGVLEDEIFRHIEFIFGEIPDMVDTSDD